MLCPASLKPSVAVAALLILAIVGAAAQGRQKPGANAGPDQFKATPQTIPPTIGPGIAAASDLAVNRALARRQLAAIDRAWTLLEVMHKNGRIELDGGTIGPWGGRRLEALRRAGAGKAEIVAALEKHISDLGRFEEISHASKNHHHPTYDECEIGYLRLEAEVWLNEERAR